MKRIKSIQFQTVVEICVFTQWVHTGEHANPRPAYALKQFLNKNRLIWFKNCHCLRIDIISQFFEEVYFSNASEGLYDKI